MTATIAAGQTKTRPGVRATIDKAHPQLAAVVVDGREVPVSRRHAREVKKALVLRREQCLAELRAFLTQQGFVNLAICSRTAEYERLAIRLQVRAAVVMQPVTTEQLVAYLRDGDQRFAALRQVLLDDPRPEGT